MTRTRLASLLTLLWAVIQVCSLVFIGHYPPRHLIGWVLAVLFLVISGGLWFGKLWSRRLFFIVGSALVVSYAVIMSMSGFPCGRDSPGCYPWALSQPILVVATLVVLLWPLASNQRLERP
jgi:hypothetical protein